MTVSVLATPPTISSWILLKWADDGTEEVKAPAAHAQEVQRLVGEFGTSGLARSEFCRIHGMTLKTLQRGLKRERTQSSDMQTDGKRLVRVKVIGGSDTTDRERLGNGGGIGQGPAHRAEPRF